MIKSTLINKSSVTDPQLVYSSTVTGNPAVVSADKIETAITTMILCNVGAPTITDESINSVTVNVYLVVDAGSPDTASGSNLIISNLTIPAGETVIFSDEKIVLSGGDSIHIGTSSANLIAATVSSIPV